MTYWNLLFLCFFLPITIIIYNIASQKHRWKVLLIASYIFFWSISGKLLIYLLFTTILMHHFGLWFTLIQNEYELLIKDKSKNNIKEIEKLYNQKKKKILIFTIIILLGLLALLKYTVFFKTNINTLLNWLNIPIQLKISQYLVPIGISFYTLQAMSYILDVYKGKIKADKNLGRLALFISFFPQIMEGPICRYSETAYNLWNCKKITYANLTFGIQRFLFGLMKKMVIADRLNPFIINVFNDYTKYDGGIIAIGMILYTVQLYMDFSGTMDMVIGIAEIFGIKLPENFKQPFFSKTISEFWTRWHITLGTWFRDYIYYPISLSNKSKKLILVLRKKIGNYYGPLLITLVSLFLVWICNGIWHGSGWNYIFFGMYHFILIFSGRLIEPIVIKINKKLHINNKNFIYKGIQIFRTTCLVFIGELFFRSHGLKAGMEMFYKMVKEFSLNTIQSDGIFNMGLDKYDFSIVAIVIFVIFIISLLKEKGINIRGTISKRHIVLRWTLYYLLILTIIVFGAYGIGYTPVDPIYAQF